MRLARTSALAVLLALAFILIDSPASADWRDGPCLDGEGQTVILDWRMGATPSDSPQLVRCILMDMTAPAYPETSPAAPLADVLVSAGLAFSAPNGLITEINGISADLPLYWHFSTGDVTEEGGQWWGDSLWSPEPTANFIGISITNGTDNAPAPIPHYAPPAEPSASPSPSPSASSTPGPSIGPSPAPTGVPTTHPGAKPSLDPRPDAGPSTEEPVRSEGPIPTRSADPKPTQNPAPDPLRNPSPEPSDQPTPEPFEEPTREPSSETIPSSRPTASTAATSSPFAQATPPAESPTTHSPATGAGEPSSPGDVGPPPSPQPVWGNEGVRSSLPAALDDERRPWSSLSALVLGLGITGGLGTALGLSMKQIPRFPVEDE